VKLLDERSIREVVRRQRTKFKLPAIGLLQSMKVTLRTMLSKAATVQYPEERLELPPRTRGVIALLEENCTVCMLCAKDCPCWCIYIEGHKEQKPGRRKPVNELDRFAIDYGLCMYCGICVEVCPFDALHWSPYFEYTSYTYEGMIHEQDVLVQWEHNVLPPPELVGDADEKAQTQTADAREKREQGIWAVIREKDKQEAYLARSAPVVVAPAQAAAAAPAVALAPAPAEAPAQAPAAEAPAAAPAPATPSGEEPPEYADVPPIDPLRLPDGISPVDRGRLKKLAELRRQGKQPTKDPVDLLEVLKPVLDQLRE